MGSLRRTSSVFRAQEVESCDAGHACLGQKSLNACTENANLQSNGQAHMATAQSLRPRYSRFLSAHPLFSSLSETLIRDLESKLIITEHSAGSVLYRQGEKPDGLYLVLSGKVKMTSLVTDDRTALLKIAEPGETLGVSALFASEVHIATAHAATASTIGLLRRDEVFTATRRYPEFAAAIIHFLAFECLQTANETLLLRVPCSSSQRLAAALLRISGENGVPSRDGVSLAYTHAELGQLIGASRETVSRLIKSFQTRGIVGAKKSAITVADRELLKMLAGTDAE
jgi:CRP/FNR family transcriptional regulator, cyclic AMP receptor protein